MNSNVKVTAVEGKVIINDGKLNKKEEAIGYIRVASLEMGVNSKGFATPDSRSALIKGTITNLSQFGWKEGQTLAGKIYHTESTVCPFEGAQAKINPETKEELTHGGLPIYRDSQYDPSGKKEDTLLVSDQALARTSVNAFAGAGAEEMK